MDLVRLAMSRRFLQGRGYILTQSKVNVDIFFEKWIDFHHFCAQQLALADIYIPKLEPKIASSHTAASTVLYCFVCFSTLYTG